MSEKLSLITKVIRNLESSGYFKLRVPEWEFSAILYTLHFIQVIALQKLTTSIMIISDENSHKFFDLISEFLLGFPRDVPIELDSFALAKLGLSIFAIIFLSVNLILMFSKVVKKTKLGFYIGYAHFYFSNLFTYVFGLTIFNVLILTIAISKDKISTNTEYYGFLAAGALGLLFLFINKLVLLQFLIPVKSEDFFSRVDNNFIFASIFQKYILSLVVIITLWNESTPTTSSKWFLIMLDLSLSIISTYKLIMEGSFFHSQTFKLSIFLQSAVLSASLSGFLSMIKPDTFMITSPSPIVQFMLFWPLVYKILINFKSALDQKSTRIKKDKAYDNHFLLNLSNNIKQNFEPEKNIFHYRSSEKYFNSLIFRTPEGQIAFLSNIAHETKSPLTKLTVASILIEEFQDYYNSYLILNSIIKSSFLSISDKLGAYCLQHKLMSLIQKSGEKPDRLMIRDYFFYIENCDVLQNHLLEYIEINKDFFSILSEKSPCLQSIATKSKELQAKQHLIDSIWKKVKENSEKIPLKLLRSYMLFINGLKTRNQEGKALMKLYSQGLENIIEKYYEVDSVVNWVNDTSTAFVYSSLQPGQYGKIFNISSSLCAATSFKFSELIGKQFGDLFPCMISKGYSELFAEITKSGSQITDVVKLESFLILKDKYLLPCRTNSMVTFSLKDGLSVGTVISFPKKSDEVILLDENGKINSATVGIRNLVDHNIKIDPKSLGNLEESLNEKASSTKMSHDDFMNTLPNLEVNKSQKKAFKIKLQSKIMRIATQEVNLLVVELSKVESSQKFDSKLLQDDSGDDLHVSKEFDSQDHIKYLGNSETGEQVQNVDQTPMHSKKRKIELRKMDTVNSRQTDDKPTEPADEEEDIKMKNIEVQSMMSLRSDYQVRRIDIVFSELQNKLKFFKFTQAHILFWIYMIFIILFAVTVMISYVNSNSSSLEVSKRIKLIVEFSSRTRGVLEQARSLWIDEYWEVFFWFYPLYIRVWFQGFLKTMALESLADLSVTSRNIERLVGELDDDDLKNTLSEKNIRVYYENYTNILESDGFILENNFRATNYLINSQSSFLSGDMITKTSKQKELREYLYVNIYNDYLVQSDLIPGVLSTSVHYILTEINNITQIIYIMSFIALSVYIMTMIYVMISYYFDTASYLSLFANHSLADLSKRIKNLEKLKVSIEDKSSNELAFLALDEFTPKEDFKFSKKKCRTSKLLINILLKRMILLVIVIIPSLILLSLSYQYPFDNFDVITGQIDKMLKIDQIGSKSLQIYHKIIINELYLNRFIFQNDLVDNTIDKDLEDLGKLISVEQNLGPGVDLKLSENLCSFYNGTETDCNAVLTGVTNQGIRGYIYYLRDLFLQERAFTRNKTYDMGLVTGMINRPYRQSVYLTITIGLVPAIDNLIKTMGSDLLGYLDAQSEVVIKEFIASIIIDITSLILISVLTR